MGTIWVYETAIGQFNIDKARDVVTNPGKFEGEPRFVIDFWMAILDGAGVDEVYGEDSETPVACFDITKADVDKFDSLVGVRKVYVWEDCNGFVRHSVEWGGR